MKDSELKEAMKSIHIREEMQEEIIRNVHLRTDGKRYRHRRLRRMAASAAAVVLLVGVVSIPVRAGLRRLVQDRMEEMTKEETAAITEMLEGQKTEADGFSREYSEAEQERMAELRRAYQEGTFPEGDLPQAEDESCVQADTLCYVKATGSFCFPDREMTDEELLEIIDFNYKRDYSLSQSARVKEQEEQAAQTAQPKAQGGLDGTEAAERARDVLESLFGVSADGMDENCYLDEERFEAPSYCVSYSIPSQCYYMLWIDAADGSLAGVSQSIPGSSEKEAMTEEAGAERIEENCQAAQSFLEEAWGIRESFENIYCLYRVRNGKLTVNAMEYYFMRADGSGYRVTYSCDSNMLRDCKRTTFGEYLENSTADSEGYREEERFEIRNVMLK